MLRADGLERRLGDDAGVSDFLEEARKLVSHVLHLRHREVRNQEPHQELEQLPKFRRRQREVVEGERARVALAPAEVDDVAGLLLLPALVRQRPDVLYRHLDVLPVVRGHGLATADAVAAPHAAAAVGSTQGHLEIESVKLNIGIKVDLSESVSCTFDGLMTG